MESPFDFEFRWSLDEISIIRPKILLKILQLTGTGLSDHLIRLLRHLLSLFKSTKIVLN